LVASRQTAKDFREPLIFTALASLGSPRQPGSPFTSEIYVSLRDKLEPFWRRLSRQAKS
jgi:hypothetical protein